MLLQMRRLEGEFVSWRTLEEGKNTMKVVREMAVVAFPWGNGRVGGGHNSAQLRGAWQRSP